MTSSWFADEFARNVFETKYQGEFKEPQSYYTSLAKTMSLGDETLAGKFFALLWGKRFSPGGRILAHNGREANTSLMNCTTHAIQNDSLEAVSDAIYKVMRASSRGQGMGLDLSTLRPKDSPVNNAARTSTGAVSFMEMINSVGGVIGQEGRRAALLFSMKVHHPDIWREDGYDFLNVKRENGVIENANISVMISDAFMRAVKDNKPWTLWFSGHSGSEPFQVKREVSARDLFREIANNARLSGEPGVIYWDTTTNMSNSDRFGPRWQVVGLNACSEATLDHEGVCNLGSMNLYSYVLHPFTAEPVFDYESFEEDVMTAVEFLDNVLTKEFQEDNSISEQQKGSVMALRRIGLGVMGLADALAAMDYRYGDDESLSFTRKVFTRMRNAAYTKSIDLAAKKGAARVWYRALYDDVASEVLEAGFYATLPMEIKNKIVQHGLRNVTLLSVAPTGSISAILGVSSGIEPMFAREYTRRIRINGDEHDEFVDLTHPPVAQFRQRWPGAADPWVAAHDVTPAEHVRVQATAQKYVDQSISKTINLPPGSTIKEVEDVYMLGWEKGLKGMAVYVDGSRDKQVLHIKEECPACGAGMIHEDGCKKCSRCDWGLCTN